MYRDPQSFGSQAGFGNSRAPRPSYSDSRQPARPHFNGVPIPSAGAGPVHEWRDGLRRSLFKNADDLKDVQRSLSAILEGDLRHLDWLVPGNEGLYAIPDVLKALHTENRDLGYVAYGHLVEVYLRDHKGDLVLTETHVGTVSQAVVEPPETLYFGTTATVADRAVRRGIMSGSKPMVTLHTVLADAMEAGRHFAGYKGDKAVVLAVVAQEAYRDGLDFAPSGNAGTFLCKFVSQRYIDAVHYEDGTVQYAPQEGNS